MSNKFPYNFLSKAEINSIKQQISEIEKSTSGEIVVSIKQKRNFLEKNKSVFELARKEFAKFKIANTKNSTGVLIFILVKDKQFYIMPDNKILKVVEEDFWYKLAEQMLEKFRSKNFIEGLSECIEKIGDVLKVNFPLKSDDKNELPDDIRFN